MSVDGIISRFIPDFVDFVAAILQYVGGVFLAGILLAVIVWAIGFAVHSVYLWLSDSSLPVGR